MKTLRSIAPPDGPKRTAVVMPRLGRKRPRDYQEWLALKRWGRLPWSEHLVPGYLLREAREAAELSQQELARRLGCSQQAISQAERWQSNPSVGFMDSWARETGSQLRLELTPVGATRSEV